MGYRKLLNYTDVHKTRGCVFVCATREQLRQELDITKCPLCFQFITVLGKRWNLALLFRCCTTYSTSLSLGYWSFDLIFTGSWRLKAHWARTWWQIVSKFDNFFCKFFILISTDSVNYLWLLFWLNKYTTDKKFQIFKKSKFSFSLHLWTVTSFGEDCLLIHCIVNKHCREEQRTLKF